MDEIPEEDIDRGGELRLDGNFAFPEYFYEDSVIYDDFRYAIARCECETEWKVEKPESGDFLGLVCPHCGKKGAKDTGKRYDNGRLIAKII